jgi:hypothetical protein
MTPTPETLVYRTYQAMSAFQTQGLQLALILYLAHLLIISDIAHACIGSSSFTVSTAQASENKSPTRPQLKAKRGKWYIFKDPDGDFTLAFPEEPTLKQVAQGPVTLLRSYEVTTDEGTTFSINFQDIGGDPSASESNEWIGGLEEILSAADRAQNVRVVQTHRLAKNIIESELWLPVTATGANINSLRRSILRRARVYTLGCGPALNGKAVNKPLCQRFFNSMRFINSAPKRAQRR